MRQCFDQSISEPQGGVGRTVEKTVVERQAVELRSDGILDAGLAVAKIGAPQAGHAIEQAVALVVDDKNTLTRNVSSTTGLLVLSEIGKGMKKTA
jgi:hypothetical protein